MMKQNENKKDETIEEQEDRKDEVTQLQDDDAVITLQKQVEELNTKYKRALADYQNLQKRSLDDRREWIQSANKDVLIRFLTMYDTLQLASKHSADQSLQISIKQFEDLLKDEGVTKIKSQGHAFDPSIMECIQTKEGKENLVLEEVRSGFMIYDKLLRPAQVIVGNGEKKGE